MMNFNILIRLFAYFAILGELSSGLSLTVTFFKTHKLGWHKTNAGTNIGPQNNMYLLCEQLKLQAFQTNKKLQREPYGHTLPDQRLTKQRLQNKSQFIAIIYAKEDLLLPLLFPTEIPYISYYWHL